MTIVEDTITALIAAQSRLSSTTPSPFGYGVDLVCVSDIDTGLAETDSTTIESLAQDCYHRITTPRGTIVDDPNFGVDVRSLLSSGLTADAMRSIRTLVQGELQKDDRVALAVCSLTESGAPSKPTITITITITPANQLSTFDLVVSVTDGQALLASITK